VRGTSGLSGCSSCGGGMGAAAVGWRMPGGYTKWDWQKYYGTPTHRQKGKGMHKARRVGSSGKGMGRYFETPAAYAAGERFDITGVDENYQAPVAGLGNANIAMLANQHKAKLQAIAKFGKDRDIAATYQRLQASGLIGADGTIKSRSAMEQLLSKPGMLAQLQQWGMEAEQKKEEHSLEEDAKTKKMWIIGITGVAVVGILFGPQIMKAISGK